MRVTSRASARLRGGRIDGRRRASIVLPTPGGPESSRLWPPAAAMVSASMSSTWPRTSARSGSGGPATARAGSGPAGREHRAGDGQVEPGPRLAQVRGREVDGQPLGRELEPGVEDGRAHALARLPHGAVPEADDGEARQARAQGDLDRDAAGA